MSVSLETSLILPLVAITAIFTVIVLILRHNNSSKSKKDVMLKTWGLEMRLTTPRAESEPDAETPPLAMEPPKSEDPPADEARGA